MGYDLALTQHFRYLNGARLHQPWTYKARHYFFELITLFYSLRPALGLYLMTKHDHLWQVYKSYDGWTFVIIELFCKNDSNLVLALSFLMVHVFYLDNHTAFRLPTFAGDVFEDYHRMIEMMEDEENRKLIEDKDRKLIDDKDRKLIEKAPRWRFEFTSTPYLKLSEKQFDKFAQFMRDLDKITTSGLLIFASTLVLAWLFAVYSHYPIIINRKWSIIELAISFLFIDRAARYSLFNLIYFAFYSSALYVPYKQLSRKLRGSTSSWMIHFRLRKLHQMFAFSLVKFDELNRKTIETLYSASMLLNLFANVALLSGLMINTYDAFFRFVMMNIISTEFFFLGSVGLALISLADCLTQPAPEVYRLMNSSTSGFTRNRVKTRLFYEVLHTKRPFRFRTLHNFASLSRKNFALFAVFYSSQLIVFISGLREGKSLINSL